MYKIFIEQNSPEPKVEVFIPIFEPLEVVKCEKCGKRALMYCAENKRGFSPVS